MSRLAVERSLALRKDEFAELKAAGQCSQEITRLVRSLLALFETELMLLVERRTLT